MAQRTIVKKGTNFVLYSDGTIRIDNLRLSYAHLATPYASTNKDGTKGKAKFSVTGIASKKTHKEAKDQLVKMIDAILAEHKVKAIPSANKFVRNGDDAGKDEYVGAWTIKASEDKRPSCRDRKGQTIDREDVADAIQSGFWGNILIRPWWQDNDFGKKVNANLLAVQLVKEDEPFGEGRISEEDIDETFESVDDDDDAGFTDDADDYDGL
jgi:hypothetical protein